MPLALIPTFLMGVLASWLGLSLLVRSPRDPAAHAFAWLCLLLTLYGLSNVVGALTSELASVRPLMLRLEIAAAMLLPPVWLNFINIVADTRRLARLRDAAVAIFLATGALLAAYALLSPDMQLASSPPRFPYLLLTACSALQRAFPLALSLWLVFRNYLLFRDDMIERRRRGFFAGSVAIAVSGALFASVAREVGWPQAPGQLLMDAGLALMAYMVLAYRMLLPARVARRTFIRSILASGVTLSFILSLLLFEPLVSGLLGLKTPLFTIFALVALVAIFAPIRDWVGSWLDRRFFHREFDYGRLLRAVSEDLFEHGDLAAQLDAGLSAICRTLKVRSGAVAVTEPSGLRMLASYGTDVPDASALRAIDIPAEPTAYVGDLAAWPDARLLMPLRRGDEVLGLLALGPKRSEDWYTKVERALLDSLSRYLALSVKHARTQQEEELAMAALAEQSRQLRAEQAQLEAQAAEARQALAAAQPAPAASAARQQGLRVAALGPLHVERDGSRIERWGGDKAGNYQAEALFAFLFDRRGKGLTKDEAEEIIWPDLDMDKADSAFHRTLSALRRTLEPGLRRGNESKLITYHHERYWLDPACVAWCDVDEHARAVERGQTAQRQGDLDAARASMEQASALYRGDYMDDCPFFGDSSDVEERREELRQQQVAVLLALGALYEQQSMVGEAATTYRRALAVSQDDCPKAEDALDRLQRDALP